MKRILSAIALTAAMLLIGSQSALAQAVGTGGGGLGVVCKSPPGAKPVVTIDNAWCTSNVADNIESGYGTYACPCGSDEKPSHLLSISCDSTYSSGNGTSSYPGQWDCDSQTTQSGSVTYGAKVECQDDAGNITWGFVSTVVTCPPITY